MPRRLPRLTSPRSGPRRALGLMVLALVAAFLGWSPVLPADAHGQLVASDPPDRGLIEVMPSRAFLTFSDPVREIREIAVIGPDGSVTNGEPTSVGAEVRQTLWAGPAGDYTMSYFVVSSDGHDVRGEVRFEVGDLSVLSTDPSADPSAAAPARTAEDPPPDRTSVVVAGTLVVLSAVVALVVLRRRRTGAPGRS